MWCLSNCCTHCELVEDECSYSMAQARLKPRLNLKYETPGCFVRVCRWERLSHQGLLMYLGTWQMFLFASVFWFLLSSLCILFAVRVTVFLIGLYSLTILLAVDRNQTIKGNFCITSTIFVLQNYQWNKKLAVPTSNQWTTWNAIWRPDTSPCRSHRTRFWTTDYSCCGSVEGCALWRVVCVDWLTQLGVWKIFTSISIYYQKTEHWIG